jgi:hypothetical protein
MYWIIHDYLCVYIFMQIIIHMQVVTELEEVGWVMVCTVCAVDYNFFTEKWNYTLRTKFFMHQSIELAIKWAEIVSDRMLHIVMRGFRWDLALIVHAPTANINYDSKDNFYGKFEQVFNQFPTNHMQILFGCRKAKFGTEDIFKPTDGKYHIVWIHQTLEKMWEYKWTVQQLFIDFKKTYDLFRRKAMNNFLIDFGINMDLII